jgi:dTDP-4-amino-4,6-dideoxygalactose transaminase
MTRVPFAKPDITDSEIQGVVEVLRGGWLTTGPRVKDFERRFATAVGADHAIAVTSCTAAMHLALDALRIGPGDEVIVPSLTFAATAEVVLYLGATPILVDVRAEDHNIDPAAIEAAWTARTRAVMPVHFAGQPCDMDEISAIARSRGAATVVDSAHCFPAQYRGRAVGTLGDISCFSFYATKTITTGEGGAAVTNNEDWMARMRSMSLHGISHDAWKRYMADGHWYYEILDAGFKYNMTEIAGSLGLAQLARADQMLAKRVAIAKQYDEVFRDKDSIELLQRWPDRDHSQHLYVIKLRADTLRIGRDEFIEELSRAGIASSVHFIPLHMHPYYRDVHGYGEDHAPIARSVYLRSISLPIYSAMTSADVQRVCEVLTALLQKFRR